MSNQDPHHPQVTTVPAGPGEGPPDIRRIPLDSIEVGEICKRSRADEDLGSLIDSIRQRGLIQFPTVMENGGAGEFLLIAGSRRYAACKALGWNDMPCHVVEVTAAEAALISLSENAMRMRRNPVEEARAYQQMKEMLGVTDIQIAAAVGLPQSGVTERLSILRLPNDILKSIDTRPNSRFKLTHAVKLAKLMRSKRPNREVEVRDLHKKAKREHLSSTEVGKLVDPLINGEYDQLPEKLQQLVMANRHMTSEMAQLFLHPEKVVHGHGHETSQLRDIAKGLSARDLEQFVRRSVNQGLSADQARERLDQTLRRRKAEQDFQRQSDEQGEVNNEDTSLASQDVVKAIFALTEELVHSRDQVEDLARFGRQELERVRRAGRKLAEQWESFEEKLTAAIQRVADKPLRDSTDMIGKERVDGSDC